MNLLNTGFTTGELIAWLKKNYNIDLLFVELTYSYYGYEFEFYEDVFRRRFVINSSNGIRLELDEERLAVNGQGYIINKLIEPIVIAIRMLASLSNCEVNNSPEVIEDENF
jgi:hypothetical protein